MTLSRLDLPRIIEAVTNLYRALESPPGADYRPPEWVRERYEIQYDRNIRDKKEKNKRHQDELPESVGEMRSSQGGRNRQDNGRGTIIVDPSSLAGWIIQTAADDILVLLAPFGWKKPPIQHLERECANLAISPLDRGQKLALHRLWKELVGWPVQSGEVTKLPLGTMELLAFLDSVLGELCQSALSQPLVMGQDKEERRQGNPKGGRPRDRETEEEKSVLRLWKPGRYRSYKEMRDKEGLHMNASEIQRVIEKHKKREKRAKSVDN